MHTSSEALNLQTLDRRPRESGDPASGTMDARLRGHDDKNIGANSEMCHPVARKGGGTRAVRCEWFTRLPRDLSPPGSPQPEEAPGVAVEPLFDHVVLERQRLVERDRLLVGQAQRARREPDHDLVLKQRVAELQELLPAR